eukprot:6336722-Karenia_brevis.AAC.1
MFTADPNQAVKMEDIKAEAPPPSSDESEIYFPVSQFGSKSNSSGSPQSQKKRTQSFKKQT